MTKQRWWSIKDLRRIRTGIDVGIYHAGFPFGRRYREILFEQQSRDLTLYERGLVAGFESATRKQVPVADNAG